MDMVDAGEANSMATQYLGNTTCVFFMAVSKQCEHNKNVERLTNETFKPVNIAGDSSSQME